MSDGRQIFTSLCSSQHVGLGKSPGSRGREDKIFNCVADCVQMAFTMSSYVDYLTESNLLDPSENAYFYSPARVSVGSDLPPRAK